jgi:hypothetical protein
LKKMIQNIILLFIVVILCVYTGCSRENKSEKITTSWVPYEVSNSDSINYYDRTQIPKIKQNITKIWTKRKLSKVVIDRHIRDRKDRGLSIDGWDKLDYEIILKEFDCMNETRKRLLIIDYNDKNEILMTTQVSNPKTEKILFDSGEEILRRIICK